MRVGQSRKLSLVEQVCRCICGLFLGFAANFLLLPLWGFQPTVEDSIGMAATFFIISIINGYVWRRLFNGVGEHVHE